MTVMQAGRELDERIAVKIFGWQHARGDDVPLVARHRNPRDTRIPEAWIYTDSSLASGIGYECVLCGEGPPPYSTDIAGAWQVVEKMQADGCSVLLHYHPEGMAEEWLRGWTVSVQRGGTPARPFDTPYVWHQAATAPLAICLAALAAVEKGG